MTQQLILIAGPYRSGTDGIQERIDANLARLENAALAVYERGHIPVIGEWLALPLAKAAGSTSVHDEITAGAVVPNHTAAFIISPESLPPDPPLPIQATRSGEANVLRVNYVDHACWPPHINAGNPSVD